MQYKSTKKCGKICSNKKNVVPLQVVSVGKSLYEEVKQIKNSQYYERNQIFCNDNLGSCNADVD
jgi:hypothetical protein